MIESSKSKNAKAFKEACKKNGLVYKNNKGTESESIKLVGEDGNCFQLNKDMSIKKCNMDDGNDIAVAKDLGYKRKSKSLLKKKSSYKIQKGLQKA